jgi:hypothetical protein
MSRYLLLPAVLAGVASAVCSPDVAAPPAPAVSVSVSASVSLPTATASTDDGGSSSGDCDCWATSTGVFKNRKLWDFRSKTQYVNVPAVPSDADGASSANAATEYLLSDAWAGDWLTQSWSREPTDSTYLMVNSPANVYIAQDDADPALTFLVLRAARHENGLQTAGELQSVIEDYQYLSARIYARTVGDDGACTAMFTYLNSDPVQEADIEWLTKDARNQVHYTNQPSYDEGSDSTIAGASNQVTMPVSMGDWAEHRLDWTDGSTEWFVNGQSVNQNSFQVPRDPTRFMFNSWSNGGSWTGAMPAGGQARLEIQWIELAYNVSSGAGGSCSNVCNLD